MRTTISTRWRLAACTAAALGLAMPALAGGGRPSTSGGPGGLGTEVPYDSRPAREYFHYFVPTDTPEALQIRDEVQKLHADHQAAIEIARAGAAAQNAGARALAQRIVDDLGRADEALVSVAKDSLIDLSGTAHDAAVQSWEGAERDLQAPPGPDHDQLFLSTEVKVLESALATVEQLRPQARHARRQQLGSVLERDRKVLKDELGAARSLAPATAAQESRRGQQG